MTILDAAFGRGSRVRVVRLSWDMWYPWTPPYQRFEKEPGVHVRLSAADAVSAADAIIAGAMSTGPGFGPVFIAFRRVLGEAALHFDPNADGSVDIYMSAHGFQSGTGLASDPGVLFGPLWKAMAEAFEALDGPAPAARVLPRNTVSGKLQAIEEIAPASV